MERGRRRYRDRWVRSTRSLRVVMGTSRVSDKKICTFRCRSVGRLSVHRLTGELHESQLRVGQTDMMYRNIQDAGEVRGSEVTLAHHKHL